MSKSPSRRAPYWPLAAPAWPAYHLGQLGLKVVGHDAGGPVWLHLLALAVVAIAFFVLAQRRLSRAE